MITTTVSEYICTQSYCSLYSCWLIITSTKNKRLGGDVVKLVEVCFLLSKEPKKHQFLEDLSLLLNELVVVAKIYDIPQAHNTFELNIHTTLENAMWDMQYWWTKRWIQREVIDYMTTYAGRMNQIWINGHIVIYAMVIEMGILSTPPFSQRRKWIPAWEYEIIYLFEKHESNIEYVIIFWNIWLFT